MSSNFLVLLSDFCIMTDTVFKILSLFSPLIGIVISHFLFYKYTKKKVDEALERYKISYSGVFKERLDIYKQILKLLHELKFKIHQYAYARNKEIEDDIFSSFNNFIRYYSENKPFLNDKILECLKELVKELQECFDNFYLFKNTFNIEEGISPEERRLSSIKFTESIKKFRKDEPFSEIQDMLESEIRKELNIEQKKA